MRNKILVLTATIDEFEDMVKILQLEKKSMNIAESKKYRLVRTGVGKVNAAVATLLALAHWPKTRKIINVGTCGDVSGVGPGVLFVGKAIQYDFDLTPLGLGLGEVPGSFGTCLDGTGTLCATADRFSTDKDLEVLNNLKADICDMEVAAIDRALVQVGYPGRFEAIKVVSDSCNSEEYAEASNTSIIYRNKDSILRAIQKVEKE